MNLYIIWNGYIGDEVTCAVIAESESEAFKLARDTFKKSDRFGHGENYWTNLKVISQLPADVPGALLID